MRRGEWIALAAILLLATLLRLYRLDAIPPGLTHDEADTGYFAAAVYRGAPSSVEGPYGYINEHFTWYSGALFMSLFGPTDLALRLHSAFFGLLVVLFTYLWARRAFGAAVGLGGAAMVALSFWTVMDSRFALNSEPAPALFTGAVYFLWLGLERGGRRWWAWALFALFLTGSLYAYEAARAAAAALVLLFLYLALFHRAWFRRHGVWFAAALLATGLLAAPHLLDPAAWGRSSTLSVPLAAALHGDLQPLLTNAISALGTLSFHGDSFVTYNLPGRPILDPVASLFFYIAVLLCLWRWRRPACAFILLWVAMGMLPSLVVGEWTSTLHSKAAEAPILTLPALGAVEAGRLVARRWGPRWGRVWAAAGVAWLVVIGVSTATDYFVRWGQSPQTRAAYFHNLAAITAFLDEGEYSGTVALSSPFPDLPLDPLVADLRLQRNDLTLRWFDGRRALLLPDAERALLVLPSSTPLDPLLASWVDLGSATRVVVHPEDVDPYFDLLVWEPGESWEAATAALDGGEITAERPPSLPADFGGGVELVGYGVTPTVAIPGGTTALVTAWRVRDPAALGPPPPHDYGIGAAIFAHLLNPQGEVVAQEDRLDVPAWNWQPGDRFLQIHRFTLPPDLPPGRYELEIGLYTRHDLRRLEVRVGDEPVGDRLLLPPLEVIGR